MKNKVEQLRESIDKIREIDFHGKRKRAGSELEVALQRHPKIAVFLKLFDYQPFHDWYSEYDKYVSGGRISNPEQFIKDTKFVRNFLRELTK